MKMKITSLALMLVAGLCVSGASSLGAQASSGNVATVSRSVKSGKSGASLKRKPKRKQKKQKANSESNKFMAYDSTYDSKDSTVDADEVNQSAARSQSSARKFNPQNGEKNACVGFGGKSVTIDEMVNETERRYYERGLNRCSENPVFLLAADYDRSSRGAELVLSFSPSFVKKLKPEVDLFNGLKISITDSRKKVLSMDASYCQNYCITAGLDILSIVVPDKRRCLTLGNVSYEDGFEIKIGENYKVKLLDSKGHLICEDLCALKYRLVAYRSIDSLFAHPKEFDRSFYKDYFEDLYRGLHI